MNTLPEFLESVEPWDEPIDFCDPVRPLFPVEALPAWQREMVIGLAEETQTPPELAGSFALSITAAALAKKYEVNPAGSWIEPVNLYTMTVAAVGERKSAVGEEMSQPIRRAQEDASIEAEPIIAQAEMERAHLEKKIAKLQTEAAKKSDHEAVPILKEAAELTAQLRSMRIHARPRLLFDDITPEKIPGVLEAQSGRAMILSPEGGLFDTLAGRYSKTSSSNIDGLLKAHAGDDIQVDRVNRPSEYVRRPALTLALAVQPDVLRNLIAKPGFKGRGLLGRILYAIPTPMVGRRTIEIVPVSVMVREEYRRRMRNLWNLRPELDGDGRIVPKAITFSPAARERFDAFRTILEPRLAPAGNLGALADWGSKYAGAVARIAACLHLADEATDPANPAPIADGTMERALTVGKFYEDNAVVAYRAMRQDEIADDAGFLLIWIRQQVAAKRMRFSKRDAHAAKRSRFPKATDLDPVLKFLVEMGYIRPVEVERGPGRPSEIYDVNPRVS
jgi:hypothetical protein